TDTEVTSFCSFCGSDVVLTGKMARTRRPARIVPFAVTREDCEKAYRDHLKHYLLAPASLKATETVSHFRPVYVPFWSYEVEAEGPARLEGKKSYTSGKYRYDETYDLTMDAQIRQKGILYDASTAFEDETAAMLRHTTEATKPFHPAYLSGFYAQGADVSAETYRSEAAASAVRLFMERVREENKMDSVEMKGHVSENFGLPDARYREELVMMPVWLLAHRQGARVVYTAINGQDGTVVCDVPVSNGKVAGVVAALAAGIFALLYATLTLKPDLLMSLCAVLALVTLYQFSSEQKTLFNRRTRAFEPDFKGQEKEFIGPAQSMLKKDKGGISARSGKGTEIWEKVKSIFFAIAVAVIFLIYTGLDESVSRMAAGMGSRGLPMGVTLVVLCLMAVHTGRRMQKEKDGPRWPRLLACLACAAGAISLITGQVEDLIYYGCAAAMLLATIIELVIMNRAHNEYASRPVPFFDGKEEAA
ncbi:MAG: hypothetical protein IJH85_09450, partial [Clostridia bacterium]|nr:hypothetical protein [Clostridia bacterium]